LRPPVTDEFHLVARHAGLVETEFFYNRDEEIYGEEEPGDYVYQVIRGAVRAYKLRTEHRLRSRDQSQPVRSLAWSAPRDVRLERQQKEMTAGKLR
jgi:hypothetical protein